LNVCTFVYKTVCMARGKNIYLNGSTRAFSSFAFVACTAVIPPIHSATMSEDKQPSPITHQRQCVLGMNGFGQYSPTIVDIESPSAEPLHRHHDDQPPATKTFSLGVSRQPSLLFGVHSSRLDDDASCNAARTSESHPVFLSKSGHLPTHSSDDSSDASSIDRSFQTARNSAAGSDDTKLSRAIPPSMSMCADSSFQTLPRDDCTSDGDHGQSAHRHGTHSGQFQESEESGGCVLKIMLAMTCAFALAEIVFGFLNNSLALIADSFHMISDAAALVVAMIAIALAKRPETDDAHSFGWHRAEVIGALVNGVYLASVCVYTVIDALFRFIEPEPITNAWHVFFVGLAGLLINVVGMMLFFSHRSLAHAHSHSHSHSHNDSGQSGVEDKVDHRGSDNINLHGVFLHVLGDAAGSVIVVATALATIYLPYAWKVYLDPICSILFSAIILKSAIGLVRHSGSILMQSVPDNVAFQSLDHALSSIPTIEGVHELHVWQMAPNYNVGSVHLDVSDHRKLHDTVVQASAIFKAHNVHRTSVQVDMIYSGLPRPKKEML